MNQLACWLVLGSALVRAVCNHGFLVENSSTNETWRFTEMLETDFTQVEDIAKVQDWIRQEFNVSAQAGHGKYAKAFKLSNVVCESSRNARASGRHEGDPAGLQLYVKSNLIENAVASAEIDTATRDVMYGSFRAGMKLTDVRGTCGAFFWYRNNTQEIDMEFLSQEFDREGRIFPVNLVIQSKESMEAGYDAKSTGTFKQVNLTFDPTAAFHEYRFDYVPGRVFFYADSELLGVIEGEAVPSSTGHLILQHWSNGNPLWSGGPPEQEATLLVSYVKAYFNNTIGEGVKGSGNNQDDLGFDEQYPCLVPNVTAVNASTGGFFFSQADSDSSVEESGAHQLYSHKNRRPAIGAAAFLCYCFLTY